MQIKNKIVLFNFTSIIILVSSFLIIIYFILIVNYKNFSNNYLESISNSYKQNIKILLNSYIRETNLIENTLYSYLNVSLDNNFIESMNEQILQNNKITENNKISLINNIKYLVENDNLNIIDIYYETNIINKLMTNNINNSFKDIKKLNDNNIYDDMFFMDLNGVVLASTDEDIIASKLDTLEVYKEVKRSKKVYLSLSVSNENYNFVIGEPIILNNKFVGLLIIFFKVNNFLDQIFSNDLNKESDYSIEIITKNKDVILNNTDYDNRALIKNDNPIFKSEAWKNNSNEFFNYNFLNDSILSRLTYIDELNWFLIMSMDYDKLKKDIYTILTVIFIVSIFLIIIKLAGSYLLSYSIVKPLNDLLAYNKKLTSNNLNFDFTNVYIPKDEIGILINSFKNLNMYLVNIFTKIKSLFKDIKVNLVSSVENSKKINEISIFQIRDIKTLSKYTDIFLNNTKSNLDFLRDIEKSSNETFFIIKDGSDSISKMIDSIKDITKEIVLIQEIAINTNLLALNASIEAARAGEFGKGFAVVANEVSKLADNSNKSANKIIRLVNNTLNISEKVNILLKQILPEIINIVDLINKTLLLSNEQSNKMSQFRNLVFLLEKNITNISSISLDSLSLNENLEKNSNTLKDIANSFKISNTLGKKVSTLKNEKINYKENNNKDF